MSASVVRLGFDRSAKVFLFLVGAAAGTGLGVAVPFLARWATGLPWVPFEGPLRLVGSFDSDWAMWGRPLLGLVLGTAFAAYVIHQSPVLFVSDAGIEVVERGNTRRIERGNVAGIYRDGNKTVVESREGRRLFRGEIEGKRDVVRDAFVTRGYPWESD
ncbi:MAG: hypothetical protein WCA46_30555 [Actinocatenispora sp.]